MFILSFLCCALRHFFWLAFTLVLLWSTNHAKHLFQLVIQILYMSEDMCHTDMATKCVVSRLHFMFIIWGSSGGVRGTVVKLRWQGCKPSHCGWVSILSKETLIRKVQRNWKVSRMSIQYYNAEQDQCVGIFFQILHWLHANTHQIHSVLVYSMEGPIGEWATYGTVDLTRVVAWFMLTLWKSGREWGKSGQMPSTRLEIYQQSHSHSFSLSGWKYWLASTLPN